MRKLIVIIENGEVSLYANRPCAVEIINLDGQPPEFVENIKHRVLPHKYPLWSLRQLLEEKECKIE